MFKTHQEVHVGPRPTGFRSNYIGSSNAIINFHNFEALPRTVGQAVESPVFSCLGHELKLLVYPGGRGDSDQGLVTASLEYCSNACPGFILQLSVVTVKVMDGRAQKLSISTSTYRNPDEGVPFGLVNKFERNRLLWCAVNGTVSFEVVLTPDEQHIVSVGQHSNDFARNFWNLFLDEESSDVAFSVKGEMIYAHKLIIRAQAPDLYIMCGDCDIANPMPINDVEPDIFRHLLSFLYGGLIDGNTVLKEHSKSMLKASGKYGFTSLKSEIEVWQEMHLDFSVESVVDELLEADGHSWPLIKKAAIDFIVEHSEDILRSESYDRLDESPSLRREVTRALSSAPHHTSDP